MKSRTRPLRHTLLFALLRGLLAAGSRFPRWILNPFGRAVGRLVLVLASNERRRALEHIAIAFPELSETARRALLRACARHFGLTLAEVVRLWRAPQQEILDLCEVTGLEHLAAARETGHGAVLITAHCGNWELLNALLGCSGIPMTIAVRELYDRRLDRIATHLRAHFGAEVVARGHGAGRRLAAALAANRIVGLLIDQDIRDIPGVFVPFFGRPAWTPSGAAVLAIRTGAPAIPAFIHRRADGTHRVEIHPPLSIPQTNDEPEAVRLLTANATAMIERQVRAHPEQWVWMHRRWRTRTNE